MILLRVKPWNLSHGAVKYFLLSDLSSAVRATSCARYLTGPPAVSIPGTVGVAFDRSRPLTGDRALAWNSLCSRNFGSPSSSKSNCIYISPHALSDTLPESQAFHLLKSHFSTTPSQGGSEEDRVSQAYIGDRRSRTVQKHDGDRLVYEVRGQGMLRFVTMSFYATAAFGLYLAPDFISSALDNEVLNQEAVMNLLAVALAVVGLPASLRLLSKRLILKLYHNEARESYVAITQSIFLTNKATKFLLEDIIASDHKSLLSKMFNLTSFKAKRQPYHVNSYNFKLPSDYNHLFGFDRGC